MSFNIPAPTIGDVFRMHHPFYVPKYQRGYAWEAEEVEDFITDISKLLAQTPVVRPHFMGGIVQVYIPTANVVSRKHEIVDGQQRMATFSLLMAAILRGLETLASISTDPTIIGSCSAKSDEIREAFLVYKETQGTERVFVPMLVLSRSDDDFFQALLNGTTAINSRVSHSRLQDAYDKLYRGLVNPILRSTQTESEKLQALIRLYSTVSTGCIVIHIVSQNHHEAYQLFAVLNDRGKNLTDGDLLRAKTLELLEGHQTLQQEAERLWDNILDGKPEDINKYFKAYFPSVTGGRAPQNDLFDTYLNEFLPTPTPASTKDFVLALSQDKALFDDIRQGEWPFRSPSIATLWDRDRLNRLVNVLRHELAHPLLLSAVKLGEAKFIKVVCLLERFVFRYITIVGAHPSPLYGPYYTEAKNMRDDPMAYNVDSLKTQLTTLITARAPDAAFRDNLLTKLVYSDNTVRNREIRHFYSTLESYAGWFARPRRRNPPTPDTMNFFDLTASTLEHIYPETAEIANQDQDMEQRKHCLANLTIMAGSDNSVIGNDVFAAKCVEFARSSVSLTRRLTSFTNWTQTEFSIRENEIVQMALVVFKI